MYGTGVLSITCVVARQHDVSSARHQYMGAQAYVTAITDLRRRDAYSAQLLAKPDCQTCYRRAGHFPTCNILEFTCPVPIVEA